MISPSHVRPTRANALAAVCAIAFAMLLAATPATAATGNISSAAGTTAGFSGDGGPSMAAQIFGPRGIATTSDGGYLIADTSNNRVRRVFSNGTITTVAGTGTAGFSGDNGAATAAQLNGPRAVAPTADGGFLIADAANNRVRRVFPNGVIATVAGIGTAGSSGDNGPATAAQLGQPRGLAITPDGGFLIVDGFNHRVRRVQPGGTITTVAGTGTQGFSGDGGAATAADLNYPYGIAVRPDGSFLFADYFNHRIRQVSGGTITTVAGSGPVGGGSGGFSGDGGAATTAQLNYPAGVALTADGGFVIADTSNERVRRVSPSGVITTVAGTGVSGLAGDGGPGASAQFSDPFGIATSPSGVGVFVADSGNHRIRLLDIDLRPTTIIQTPPSNTSTGVPAPRPAAPADRTAPTLRAVGFSPSVFRVAPGATALAAAKAPRGAQLRFTLSEPATVRIAVQQSSEGRRSKGACRKPTAKLRKAKRCTRWTTLKTLTRSKQAAGKRSIAFTGRLGRQALRPGRYRVQITATDAARNRSKTGTATFRVVR